MTTAPVQHPWEGESIIPDERTLAAAAVALGGPVSGSLSPQEAALAKDANGYTPAPAQLKKIKEMIRAGSE